MDEPVIDPAMRIPSEIVALHKKHGAPPPERYYDPEAERAVSEACARWPFFGRLLKCGQAPETSERTAE